MFGILFSILTHLNAKNLRVCRCAGFIHTACSCFLQYAHACREAPRRSLRRKEIIFIYERCKIKKCCFFFLFFFSLCFIGNIYVQKLYSYALFSGDDKFFLEKTKCVGL